MPTSESLPAMPQRKAGSEREPDLDEREREKLQQLSAPRAGVDLELPYIQWLLDGTADELDLELIAASLEFGNNRYFVSAHELDTWAQPSSESSTRLVYAAAGMSAEFAVDRFHRKFPLHDAQGTQIGALHVVGDAARPLSPTDIERIEELVCDVTAVLERN